MKSSSAPQRSPLAYLNMGSFVVDSAPRESIPTPPRPSDEKEAIVLHTPDTPRDPYKDFDKINSQPASSWPSSSFRDSSPIPTTSVDAVLAEAELREEEEDERWKKFFEENPEASADGVADAAAGPSVMSFFAGKSYDEGRRLYNEHLTSQGKAPLREGRH